MNKQEIEQLKYKISYTDPAYKMGLARKRTAEKCIAFIEEKEKIFTHLDVSTGRGELIDSMRARGIESIGTEIVTDLLVEGEVFFAWSNKLPFEDNSFDLVTNLDAMEHYLPEQTEEIIEELCRVSKRFIYFSISNIPSFHKGNNLHINIKEYKDWETLLSNYGKVSWVFKNDNRISENFILEIHENY